MKKFVLFLRGSYFQKHLSFYRTHIEGKFTIAVDGGYAFFAAADLIPDLLIGDFDSLPRSDSELPKAGETIRYPANKDKTDAQLALEYCLEHEAISIEFMQPEPRQPDHYLGNLFLLTSVMHLPQQKRPSVRILNHESEIRCVEDETIDFRDRTGDTVSVIPLSKEISLDCRGVKYAVEKLLVKQGESRSLRNVITSSHAAFRIIGRAIVVRLFGPA